MSRSTFRMTVEIAASADHFTIIQPCTLANLHSVELGNAVGCMADLFILLRSFLATGNAVFFGCSAFVFAIEALGKK